MQKYSVILTEPIDNSYAIGCEEWKVIDIGIEITISNAEFIDGVMTKPPVYGFVPHSMCKAILPTKDGIPQ